MKTRTKKMIALLLSVVMVVCLAACGGGDAETKDTLYVQGYGMDEIVPVKEATADAVAAHAVFDTLLMFDQNGDIAPMVAESWDTSEDGMTYTFHIDEKAVFSDGSKIKASDIVYALDETIAQSWGYFLADYIGSYEAVDDNTLVVTKAKSYVNTLGVLATYAFAIPKDVREADKEAYDEAPTVGSGPYVFESREADNTVNLVANENYYLEKPGFVKAQIKPVVDTATSVLALENGELDLIPQLTEASYVKPLEEKGMIVGNPTDNYSSVAAMLCGKRLNDDKNLRKAIAYGISRENAIALANEGMGEPLQDLYSASVMGDLAGKVKAPQYDPEKAKEYLAKSDYDGTPITLTITSNPKLAESIQADLKEIGIEIKIEQIDNNSWAQKLTGGELEMSVMNLGTVTIALGDMLGYWSGDNPLYGPLLAQNDEYDQIMRKLPTMKDQAEIDEALIRACEISADMCNVFSLYSSTMAAAISENVTFDYDSAGAVGISYLNYVKPAN